jgi:mannosyltransferase OCH1-like enzyme
MIPKIIHQIYFNLHDKEIEEIPLFKTSSNRIQKMYPDFEYRLWNEISCSELVKKELPEYFKFYSSLRYEIQKIDYMRFVLLYLYGGVYVDLDLIPIRKMDNVLKQPFFTNTIRGLVPDHCEFVQNDFMGSIKGFELWNVLLKNCQQNYEEKANIEVYNVRTARFVLHTTGPRYLSRIIKKVMPKYIPSKKLIYTKYRNDNWKKVNRDEYLFENYVAGSWFETMSNNKASKTFYLTENEL